MDNQNLSTTTDGMSPQVSLPGVADNEQPTILEVLNRGISNTEEGRGTGNESSIREEDRYIGATINTQKSTSSIKDTENRSKNDDESDILVIKNSENESEPKRYESQRSKLSEDEDHVLDIESHLIETLNDYSVSENSESWGVDIKELPPSEGESSNRTSKIESDPLVGSVIEVEPATPKILKPVETNVPEPQKQNILAQKAQTETTSQFEDDKRSDTNQLPISDNKDSKSQIPQNVNSNPETETVKPIWTIVKELQNEFESHKLSTTEDKTNAHLSKVQLLSVDPEVESSADHSETDPLSEEAQKSEFAFNSSTEDSGIELSKRLEAESEEIQLNESTNLLDESESNQNLEDTVESCIEASADSLDNSQKIHDKSQVTEAIKTLTEPTASDPKIKDSSGDKKTDSIPIETTKEEDSILLSDEIDQKLSEFSTHLRNITKIDLNGNISELEKHIKKADSYEQALDVNGLPLPKTAQEEEQRQQFLDSLPQISLETDSNKVAALAKREYYQSLRQYLITHVDKPPHPPETYRWEDLKRAKQRGGYPWTHLYKRPLGPDEEPEIVLLLRKSQELRFTSESPKSFKKVRIDDQVSIKETERYIQELSDTEENHTSEDEEDEEEEEEEHGDERSECISCVSDSVLTVEKKASKLGKLRSILKKRSPKKEVDSRSLPDTSTARAASLVSSHKSAENINEKHNRPEKETHHKAKCFPIMKKLKSMADRQKKNLRNIKKISLKKDEKIALDEEQKIIKLKTSPKAVHSEIPHFIEKQDSDDVLEIIELDESPSRKRKDQLELQEQASAESTVVVPDEIIEIPTSFEDDSKDRQQTPEPTVSEILEEELKSSPTFSEPPKKSARLRREHVYEDIEDDNGESLGKDIDNILEAACVEALKNSLAKQDISILKDVEAPKSEVPLERMGSSEEEIERSHLAPISSIDSASSEEERKPQPLPALAEESDTASIEGVIEEKEVVKKLKSVPEIVKERSEHLPWTDIELKPVLKKEASPSPSEKKVTFSHVEDEAEPHREDIELPEGVLGPKRWSNLR